MAIAAFAFAWMNLLAKYLNDFHPLQVVFFRAFGTFIFIFPYMLSKKISIIGNNVFWLTLRGVLSFVSLSLFFVVIQRIPLGSAVALRYTAPVFSVFLAALFLKERVKVWQWFALGLALSGSVIGSLFFINQWRMPIGQEWWYVCSIGVLGMIGQIFLTKSFQLAETSVVAPIKYMELVYALIFGFFLFGEHYTIFPILGMSLIVLGMLWNVWLKKSS